MTKERMRRIVGLRHDPEVRRRACVVRDVFIDELLRPWVGHGTDVAVHVAETSGGLRITAWPTLGRKRWDAPWPPDAIVYAVSRVPGPKTQQAPFSLAAKGITRNVSFALVAPDFAVLFPTAESMADMPE